MTILSRQRFLLPSFNDVQQVIQAASAINDSLASNFASGEVEQNVTFRVKNVDTFFEVLFIIALPGTVLG